MKIILAAWVFLATLTSPLYALQGTLKDGPHASYATGGDVRNERTGFGWQVAYEWSDYLSAEWSITRQKDQLDDQTFMPAPFDSTLDLEIVHIVLSGRVGYPIGRVTPYWGGGVGYYWMRTESDRIAQSINENRGRLPAGLTDLRAGADLDDTFGYHIAAGLEWRFVKDWEVFVEYRYTYVTTDITYRIIKTRRQTERTTTGVTETFDYDHGLVRLGLNYRF